MKEERKVPDIILRNYYPKKSLDIRYDKDVNENDKIPGLVEFLKCEYDQLLKSKECFILFDDISDKKAEDHMQPIPVILSNKCPKDKGYRMNNNLLAKIIARELKREHSKDEEEEIVKNILNFRNFQPNIIGRYFPNSNQVSEKDCDDNIQQGPYIELYYRNTFCPDEEDYKAWLSACLAHEYFHFIQDSYLGIDLNKKGLKNRAVIESLAEFFSFAYCLNNANRNTRTLIDSKALIEWAKKRSDTWRNTFGSKWPYAYAYCFFYGHHDFPMQFSDLLDNYYKHGCKDRYNIVLDFSESNMRGAYRELTRDTEI